MTENPSVTNFRNYIQIKTVQPDPDYYACAKFLRGQAADLRAECQEIECVAGKPIILMTIPGEDPTLKSLLLNSHTDVVPVYPEYWKYEPFSAHKDEEGNIYGRGTQDMKCVGIQYIEALKRLRKEGATFLRTIHLTFVPDEEVGGVDGMRKFVDTLVFKKMNVGFCLDEGIANPTDKFSVFYGERYSRGVMVRCQGQPGHGSQFLDETSGEKLIKVISSFMDFRKKEKKRLHENKNLRLGDVTTLNLNLLKGGVQMNVIPAELAVGFDIRVSPSLADEDLKEMLDEWCKEAGEGVSYEFVTKHDRRAITSIDEGKNPWWNAFVSASKSMKMDIETAIFPAATDARYMRALGIPAIGFSPINNTPILLHDNDEFLNEKIFLRGIEIYTAIIPALANLQH